MVCNAEYKREPIPETHDLEILLSHYFHSLRSCCKDDLSWIIDSKNIVEAITKAASAETKEGKRHPHQWRISKELLREGCRKLRYQAKKVEGCESFDSLLHTVIEVLEKIKGLGELYYYDTALRLGAYLGLHPEKVYLHRGTREGAKALGLDVGKGHLEMSGLPLALQKLSPEDVEDFLCRYKSKLRPGVCP